MWWSAPATAELNEQVAVGAGQRIWLGPELWANPMPDWRVEDQTIVAAAGLNRTAHALGRRVDLSDSAKQVALSVTVQTDPTVTRAGFRIGINGQVEGPRGALLAHGVGVDAAIDAQGRLFLHDQTIETELNPKGDPIRLELRIAPKQGSKTQVTLTLVASDPSGKRGELECVVARARVSGSVALLAENPFDGPLAGGKAEARSLVRFKDWRISGDGVVHDAAGRFGPILWSQYTLADGKLKVSAQMPPLEPDDSTTVFLDVSDGESDWREVAQGTIDGDARVAVLVVEGWDRDTPTNVRLRYGWQDGDAYWPMTIRPELRDDEPVQIAGFSCDHGYAFPLSPMVDEVLAENPDLVFFAGDQIYEPYGGFGVLREGPVEISLLDYLRKYYQFGWTWREVLAHRPSVIIPDDHDVFHGNIWGEAGRQLLPGERPVQGGYQMPPRFVNAVQRTQTAHLPDPYDPTPTDTGIGVYYTSFRMGPLDLAVIEDRKWKRGPGRVKGGQYDRAVLADAPLLGERQEKFLTQWKEREAPFKVLLSQTMLAKPATHAGWKLAPQPRDPDCNGWPMPARDRAAKILGPDVVAIVGDQHLGMLARIGVDRWDDGPITLMVPGTANGHPRAWMPDTTADGLDAKAQGYTGEYIDGLGNRLAVLGVANPEPGSNTLRRNTTHPYELARQKGSGYGMAQFDPASGLVDFDLRRMPTPASASSPASFPGFPVQLKP
ncbi:MAG: alkaline phosphatase D family protein [Planctomycetota bacterium]